MLLKEIPSHADVQKKPHSDECGDDERPPITEQGKGDSYHRHDPQHHSDVNEDMPEEHRHHPESKDGAKTIFRLDGNAKSPENQRQIEPDDKDRSDQAPLLPQG